MSLRPLLRLRPPAPHLRLRPPLLCPTLLPAPYRAPHRAFHPTPPPRSPTPQHHFDTLAFIDSLKRAGFSESQSSALLSIFQSCLSESITSLSTTLVPRSTHSQSLHTQSVDFVRLRNELSQLHASELTPLKQEQERLSAEIVRLRAKLREEVQRAQSSVKLDLSLEKGRIREEASVHELKVRETDTRIEKEVGDLRGVMESVKFSTLQWLIGVCTGTAALLLGVWRLLM